MTAPRPVFGFLNSVGGKMIYYSDGSVYESRTDDAGRETFVEVAPMPRTDRARALQGGTPAHGWFPSLADVQAMVPTPLANPEE